MTGMDIETRLREIADLCRQAGEYTAWLAPKIEAVILALAHERTAEDERRGVLAFLGAEVDRQEATMETMMSATVRERCSARAEILRAMSAYIERGDHVGAAALGGVDAG